MIDIRVHASDFVRPFYNQPHRFFHKWSHIASMLDVLPDDISLELYLAILFHDIVYVAHRNDNEVHSSIAFSEYVKTLDDHDIDHDIDIDVVCKLIQSTAANIAPSTVMQEMLHDANHHIFTSDLDGLLRYEQSIFKEYQIYPLASYIKHRLRFLSTLKLQFHRSSKQYLNIELLIDHIRLKEFRIGIFAGTFNPYHIGHENICIQAEKVFDKVILAQVLPPKTQRVPVLTHAYRQVITHNGLLTDLFNDVSDNQSLHLVRGLRSSDDLDHEIQLRTVVKEFVGELPISYFICDEQYSRISSALIRSLRPYGSDAYSHYLPTK